jgi:hypothetical protein
MKSIMNKILLTGTLLIIVFACREDGEIRLPELQTGVNARVILAYPDNTYFNLSDISNAVLAFDVYSKNSDLDRIEYMATYTSAAGVVSAQQIGITVPASAFKNGKAERISVSATTLAQLFNLPGGTAALQGGDSFTFTPKAYLKDGRIIDANNSAPSITNGANASFTSQIIAYVGCPSNATAIAGTYRSTMEFNNFGLGIGKEVMVTVTFVGPEPFRYRVTDHTAELYVPFDGTQYVADFYDICGTAVLQPATSFGTVINYVPNPPDANFGSPAINTSTAQTTFHLNWNETNNGILASVRFEKIN